MGSAGSRRESVWLCFGDFAWEAPVGTVAERSAQVKTVRAWSLGTSPWQRLCNALMYQGMWSVTR